MSPMSSMSSKAVSRRAFLKTTGIVLGGAVLAGTGVTFYDASQPTLSLPQFSFGDPDMSIKILVTYASQGGSTAGVAEAIGKTLAEGGVQVDVRPVATVTELTPYRAVVIGSAVHSGSWMPEAQAFVERNRSALRSIPTAIFQVCMMLATGSEQYREMVPNWMEPLRAEIHPVAEGSFAGALFPDRYPRLTEKLGLRIFLSCIKTPAGDYRDWNAIRAWANRLHPLLIG